jgi:hypothetical protein
MLTTIEMKRRMRVDVCSHCGWGRVQNDEGWECVNPQCFRPLRGSQWLPRSSPRG